MKSVLQVVYNKIDGDCFEAALASIFELELNQVPRFSVKNWWQECIEWLKPMNLTLLRIFPDPTYHALGYTIASVERGKEPDTWSHAVVYLDGEPLWDPTIGQPRGEYKVTEWMVFVVLDPSQPVNIGFWSNDITKMVEGG